MPCAVRCKKSHRTCGQNTPALSNPSTNGIFLLLLSCIAYLLREVSSALTESKVPAKPPRMNATRIEADAAHKIGAQERTRTSTPLRELAPEASASANSATWAFRAAKRGETILPRSPWFVNEARRGEVPLTPGRAHPTVILQSRARGGQPWQLPARCWSAAGRAASTFASR